MLPLIYIYYNFKKKENFLFIKTTKHLTSKWGLLKKNYGDREIEFLNFNKINYLNKFFFRNINNVFFYIENGENDSPMSFFSSKTLFFTFCYGMSNYQFLRNFLVFVRSKKKIIVLPNKLIIPGLLKVLVKTRSIFFIINSFFIFFKNLSFYKFLINIKKKNKFL